MKLRKRKELQVQEARENFLKAVRGTAIMAVPMMSRKQPMVIIIACVLGYFAASRYSKSGKPPLLAGRVLQKLLK